MQEAGSSNNWTNLADNGTTDLSSTLTWVALGHCCVSIALLSACIHLLSRRPFSRYQLGCLLIIRWNCVADLLCLLHKAGFTVLNRPDLLNVAGRHVTAWVCKLYHFSDNATTTAQVWLLALFAMERAAMSISPRLALKHFSQFRLRIGATAAGAVGLAGHLNYIWMFSIVSPHESRRSGTGAADEAQLASTNATEDYRLPRGELVCGILPEFHTVYVVSIILEVVANAYAPALLFGASAVIVLLDCLRSRRQPNQQLHQHQRSRPRQQQLQQQQQQQQSGFESVDFINASSRALFLVLAVVCYPPLAATGAFKARTVHLRKELSPREYILLLYILQPLKNVLSAIAYFAFVCCVLLTHKHDACRRLLPSRYKQPQQQQQQLLLQMNSLPARQPKESSCSEAEIPLRTLGNSTTDEIDA